MQESQPPSSGKDRSTGATQRSPGGFIIIPIGLIITLIIAVFRMTGGPAQKNGYPESDVNSLNFGLSYYEKGDYPMAIMQFNMVIASQPEMGEAYNDRGLTYFAMGETNQAISDFNKAIELMPDPAISYSNRGGLYLSQGNHAQALADLDKAIELSPRLAKAFYNRGLTYLDLENYDQAIADFDQAIQLTPETMFSMQATLESRQPAGESLLSSGFLSGFMDRQTYADLPRAYASRALAYQGKGETERAAADLEKASQLGLDLGYAQQVEAMLAVSTWEPQPVSTLVPQTGHWEGSSNYAGYQGAVSFDIEVDGQVHDFKLDLVLGKDILCQAAVEEVLMEPDGTFSFTFDTPDSEGSSLNQGEFESSTAAVGSLNRYIECLSTSGELITGVLPQEASWSATWISSPEEIPTEMNTFEQPTNPAVQDESEALAITALAIDPVNPSTLYAGTYGGVFKSSDGGEVWLAVNAGLPGSRVSVLVIDPQAPETLYAGTSLGLFKSSDGAQSWRRIDNGLIAPNILTLVLDPLETSTIYVGTLAGVYKSTDGGATWAPLGSELSANMIYTLVTDPLTPSTLYAGTPEGVFKTMDGGGSWLGANNGLPKSFVHILAADPVTPGTLYAGTGEGLYKSSDSGESWTRSFWSFPILACTLDPKMPSNIYIARSDGIFSSADSGANWSVIYGTLVEVYVNVLAVDPLTPGGFYAGTDKGLFRITDSGRNWQALNTDLQF